MKKQKFISDNLLFDFDKKLNMALKDGAVIVPNTLFATKKGWGVIVEYTE